MMTAQLVMKSSIYMEHENPQDLSTGSYHD